LGRCWVWGVVVLGDGAGGRVVVARHAFSHASAAGGRRPVLWPCVVWRCGLAARRGAADPLCVPATRRRQGQGGNTSTPGATGGGWGAGWNLAHSFFVSTPASRHVSPLPRLSQGNALLCDVAAGRAGAPFRPAGWLAGLAGCRTLACAEGFPYHTIHVLDGPTECHDMNTQTTQH
jgi:hypothetical protein